MNEIDIKLNEYYGGKVVRKDLTKSIKEGANVPSYVLEYLLGMYCATDNEEDIDNGKTMVKHVLADNFVRPDEAEKIKSKIRERGHYKIIDKVSAKLNEHTDSYEGQIFNINISHIFIDDTYVKNYEKLLCGGIWCIIDMAYNYDENTKDSPFQILSLKPIQMPATDVEEFLDGRKHFTLDEWIEVICRSVGMEPTNLDEKTRWHLVARMIPFVENNYNICELGPEMHPYTRKYFEELIRTGRIREITPSNVWYGEREDFTPEQVGKQLPARPNQGFELLQGPPLFSGKILGGCIDSMYDFFHDDRYADMPALCRKYQLFPDSKEWEGYILLLESSEEKPTPEKYQRALESLKETGVFSTVSGVLVGKPMDETYAEEYKQLLVKVIDRPELPIVFNVNIGHAMPRCIIPFGVEAVVDVESQIIRFAG